MQRARARRERERARGTSAWHAGLKMVAVDPRHHHLLFLVQSLPLEVTLGGLLAFRLQKVLLRPISVDAPRHAHVRRQTWVGWVEGCMLTRHIVKVIADLVARQPRRDDAIGVQDHAILLGILQPLARRNHLGDAVAINTSLTWSGVLCGREMGRERLWSDQISGEHDEMTPSTSQSLGGGYRVPCDHPREAL